MRRSAGAGADFGRAAGGAGLAAEGAGSTVFRIGSAGFGAGAGALAGAAVALGSTALGAGAGSERFGCMAGDAGRAAATGRAGITGAIGLPSGMGFAATRMAGRPLLTEANCWRFCAAACRCCNWVFIGGMRCSRVAAISVGRGRRVIPPGPL